MNILNEVWKIASAAWVDIVKNFICFFLRAQLVVVNQQIDGAKRYIAAVNINSTNFTKSIARYFEEKMPEWTAEREAIEAQMESNGCMEK